MEDKTKGLIKRYKVTLTESPSKVDQLKLWLDHITGSQVYHLSTPSGRWNLLMDKHLGIVKKSMTTPLMKHGNYCEEKIAIPFIEKSIGKCEKKLHLTCEDLKASGNMDYYNKKKFVVGEIKTTSYDSTKNLMQQTNPTINKAIGQLLFYRKLIQHLTGKYPSAFLCIVDNTSKCVATNCTKEQHGVYIFDFDVQVCNDFRVDFNQMDILGEVKSFWDDWKSFNAKYTQNQRVIADMKALYFNKCEIKELKDKSVKITKDALKPFNKEIKHIKDSIEYIEKINIRLKAKFKLGTTIYDPESHVSLHKHQTPINSLRTNVTVKRWKI